MMAAGLGVRWEPPGGAVGGDGSPAGSPRPDGGPGADAGATMAGWRGVLGLASLTAKEEQEAAGHAAGASEEAGPSADGAGAEPDAEEGDVDPDASPAVLAAAAAALPKASLVADAAALPSRMGGVSGRAVPLAGSAAGPSSGSATPAGKAGAAASKKKASAAKGSAKGSAGGAASDGSSGLWQSLRGEERVPSQREWQAMLADAAVVPSAAAPAPGSFSGPRGLMVAALPGPTSSHVLPASLAGLPAVGCRAVFLADRWHSAASLKRYLRDAALLPPHQMALQSHFETAVLLSLTGVGTVVTNQLPVTRAAAVEAMLDCLHGALCKGMGPCETTALRRRRVTQVPAAGKPADALGMSDAPGSAVVSLPVALKLRASLAPAVWGLGLACANEAST
ncbi:hypothetical protein FNF27_07511 [Cafeteria roenbergensis]|uniref:Uncharacterized protein n=1 Tax=Cafeteria roenbergensis TaxID=33653 RepID=A0A5A8DMH5_CAFRO|nr:hypothetical protein FNF27_07511 [Cafeteria roenbergensis]